MEVTKPSKLMLGRALLMNQSPCLLVKRLDQDVAYDTSEFFKDLRAEKPFCMPGVTLGQQFLVVEILPPEDYHLKLEHEFSFKEFEVLTMIDGEPKHHPLTLAQVRELIHDLSVSYNGKTFLERDFHNAVFMQTSVARDDNRNQDECYNDASSTVLYLFVYGFIHHILSNVPEKVTLVPQKFAIPAEV